MIGGGNSQSSEITLDLTSGQGRSDNEHFTNPVAVEAEHALDGTAFHYRFRITPHEIFDQRNL